MLNNSLYAKEGTPSPESCIRQSVMTFPEYELQPILCPNLSAGNSHIKHGFFTRQGGVSTGLFKSMNIGPSSSDNPNNVAKNRRAVVQYLGLDDNDLLTTWQHHSPDVVVATHHWGANRPTADSIVTSQSNLPIAVVTADCGPVLFCDAANEVIGAAHAGWRGATSGILQETVETMINQGAKLENIRATLGPTISGKNYEVGPEFVENLLGLDTANTNFLSPSGRSGHAHFDLPAYIIKRLTNLGVNAQSTGQCTYEDEDHFFSYRRMTHRREADYGRQISAIAIIEK